MSYRVFFRTISKQYMFCTGMWIDNLKITGLRAGAPHKALGEIMNPHKSISYFESKVYWCINVIS